MGLTRFFVLRLLLRAAAGLPVVGPALRIVQVFLAVFAAGLLLSGLVPDPQP